MVEISLNNIDMNYGSKNILDNFNLKVSSGEKIAIIGKNGSGKSTLFKLITKKEIPNKGNIMIKKDSTIGFLQQMPEKKNYNLSVYEILLKNFENIVQMEKEMHVLEKDMSSNKLNDNQLQKLLNKYGKLQEKFINADGYIFKQKINKICNGFSFDDDFINRSFNSLSGGEKTKVMFASLLLKQPNILLLDEPTNHLDINTLEWLEDFLKNYKGTILIISHDRYFLDKVTNKTILINKGKEEIFFGNYSYYVKENERRILSEFDAYKNQQTQISAMKKAIKKLREWGKVGDNESFFKRANCIEKRLDKLEVLEKPETKKELFFNFEISDRSGKDVLVADDLGIIFGDKIIFNGASMSLKYGEKVCIMGENGSGKSTFVKSILNDKFICQGEIKIGSNVNIGYIPQEIKFDDDNATVLEIARKFYEGTETHLRAALAKFLFYGQNVFLRVGNLSGGEKVRLKLFELIQKKANLLILDEPTNHIDIDTKEILEEALLDYKGTLLSISHDRYFINILAQRIINIENRKFKVYLGNYENYKEQKVKKLNKFLK